MFPPYRTVLIVEDEPLISEIYRTVFAARKYVVLSAFNKQSAMHLIETQHPHVILLDLMIPIGPGEQMITYDHPVGFDILEWVRHHQGLVETSVIVVSNLDSAENRQRAQELGAAGYLVKADIEPHELVRQVDTIVAAR